MHLFGYLSYLLTLKENKKSTCLFNAGFYKPICIPSLILKEYNT